MKFRNSAHDIIHVTMKHTLRVPVLLSAIALAAYDSRADLVGHDIELSFNGCAFFSGVLPASGYDLSPSMLGFCDPQMQFVITGSSLTFSFPPPIDTGGGGGPISLIDLSDSAQVFTGVSVDPATNTPGADDPTRLSFTDESATFSITGLQFTNTYTPTFPLIEISSGQVVLDFTFTGDPAIITPEPRTMWLPSVNRGIFQ